MNDMMAREIAAQGEILARVQPELAARADAIAPARGRIFAGGCGDSAFAPSALSDVFDALGQPVISRTSMALAGFTRLEAADTVILSSISGGTKRTVEAAEVAAKAGARVVAITCNADSALAAAAHDTIVLPFQPLSRKTPHTLDYAVTLLSLVEIARSFAGRAPDATRPVVDRIAQFLSASLQVARLVAAGHDGSGKIVILGAGPDLGTAEYGAAKFHEAGGLVAIAAETENFVHGMNFMLERNDTVIALGGTAMGLRRARQIAEALDGWLENKCIYTPGASSHDRWLTAFASVLEQTFFLQQTCLEVANRLSLQLEQPRAGRGDGAAYLSIQSRIMAT